MSQGQSAKVEEEELEEARGASPRLSARISDGYLERIGAMAGVERNTA